MASTGDKRQKWIDSIKKELDSFKNNHATEVISHELKEKCRQVGHFPLPMQMVFVEKPDLEAEVKNTNTKTPQAPAIKHKSRMDLNGHLWQQTTVGSG
eukprot:605531-Amphidinium_carterae.2